MLGNLIDDGASDDHRIGHLCHFGRLLRIRDPKADRHGQIAVRADRLYFFLQRFRHLLAAAGHTGLRHIIDKAAGRLRD